MTNTAFPALSVRQPWAWATLHGGKDIENRSAAAVRHGMTPRRIVLHAAKGMTRRDYEDARAFMAGLGVICPSPADLIRGAVIGTATVTAIVKDSASPWFFGPRGLVLADPEPCSPIAAVGQLGYFQWTPAAQPLPQPLPWMLKWPGPEKPQRTAGTKAADTPSPQATLFE